MSLSSFSIRRPYVVFALLIGVMLFGFISLSRLPVDMLPKVSMPKMVIMVPYPGAGPQEVEKNVVEPLERWLGTLAGLDEIESDARQNMASVQLTFDWGVKLDNVDIEVRDRLDMALAETPDEVAEPLVLKLDASLLPQMMIGISGGGDAVRNREVAEDVAERLQRVREVAAAEVMGGAEREVAVELDRRRLASYGIHPSQIEMALKAHNLDYPLGSVKRMGTELELRLIAEYDDLGEIERTIVGEKGERPVYLGDVARVRWSKTEPNSALNVNGRPSVSIMIQKTSGANTIGLSRRLLRQIEEIRKELPEGMELTVLYDSARFVKTSLRSTFWNLLAGAVLAGAVLFIFLGGLRRTGFVGAAIPLSVFIALIGVELAGYRIDILSLAGFTVAIGMVVDASIVVFEAIHRHNTKGLAPAPAAHKGTKEVGAAILSSTLTTIAVFVPLLFLRGFVSILFTEFSWVMILTLGASLLVALTFIPTVASRFMRHRVKETAFKRWFERLYGGMEALYMRMLGWALKHRAYIVFLGLGLFALSITAMAFHQKDFFPAMDRGELTVDIKAPAGTSLEEMQRRVSELERLILDSIPELEVMQTSIGGGEGEISTVRGVAGTNNAQIMLYLVSKTKRRRSSKQVEAWLREKAKQLAGLEVTPAAQALGSIAFGAEDVALGGTTPIVIEIEGYDLDAADSLALTLVDSLAVIPGLVDIRTSASQRRPEIAFRIRRDLASRFGMTPYELGRILRTEIAGSRVTAYRVEGEEFDVRVRLNEADRSSVAQIASLEIPTPVGMVPLSNMVTVERSAGPGDIHHKNTHRIRTVGANLKDRDLGSASEDVRALLKRIEPPPGIKLRLTGGFGQMKESFSDLCSSSCSPCPLLL